MRYLSKIPIISLLEEKGDNVSLLDEACAALHAIDDTTTLMPGVNIKNAEVELEGDTTASAELWIVTNVLQVDFEEIMKGSDGMVFLVDPALDPSAETTLEYLNILERSFRFLPAMIVVIDDTPMTVVDDGFMRKIWETRVVECMALNRTAPDHFTTIMKILLEGIVKHSEAGPIAMESMWLRESLLWQILAARIETDLAQADKVFLGRSFYVLSLAAKAEKKLESLVLGSIAARWLEMATDYSLAVRICEQLGEKTRARFLKQKQLDYTINQATALINAHKFKDAALKFQEAAYWNRNEFVNYSLGDTIFVKAIDAWVSIFEFEKLLDLLGEVKSPVTLLSTLKEKIEQGIDHLVQQQMLDKVNFQLDIVTKIYLKHDLRESATEIAERHARIKLDLLKEKVEQRFIGDSLLLVDELVGLRDKFELDVPIPDDQLAAISVYLIEEQDFNEFEKILGYIQDPMIIKQLSARRVVKEQESDIEKKDQAESLKKNLFQRLLVYSKEEKEDALQYAISRRTMLFSMIDQGDPSRAENFLKINAQWLKDLEQPDIAGDLVFQVSQHLVKNGCVFDVKWMLDYLPAPRQEDLMNHIVEYINARMASESDLHFSNYIDHFQNQARINHFHSQADDMAITLAKTLLQEARTASMEQNPDAIKLAMERIDKFKVLSASTDLKDAGSENIDDILANVIQFQFDSNDLKPIEGLMNQVVDLDTKRRFTARLDQLSQERELQKVDEYKKQEEIRDVREELLELKRLLLLEQHKLANERAEREELLQAWKDDKKIPDKLACFVMDPDIMPKMLEHIERNQQAAMQFFIEDVNPAEVAVSMVVSLLFTLKRNDVGAATSIIDITENLEPQLKIEVLKQNAWKIVALLVKAIHLESGSEIADAIMLAELLPLVNGERFLVYKVLRKPVPVSVKIHPATIPVDEFGEQLGDALSAIIEMASMEFEPVQMALIAQRQMLEREKKLQGLSMLKQKKLDRAAMLYQGEALKFFDDNDVFMGWTSLWISIMIMAQGHVNVDEISSVLANIIKTYKDNEQITSNTMVNGMKLFLKCLERKMTGRLHEFKGIFDLLPLLDVEKGFFDASKINFYEY
ncbi:MAG TPA: hypothetical protein VKM55_14245 [Candidatus Lokiarchaeia archaeon]|nr:hypothetical protein [Candidatus Lokiarchaeia archaeon]